MEAFAGGFAEMPASLNIALPLSSWGEFGLLVATRLKHRAMVVYTPQKQPNGTLIDVVLALPNRDTITLTGSVIESDREQLGDHETWVTRLSLKDVSENELSRWELLARQRPNRPSQAPRVAPVSQ